MLIAIGLYEGFAALDAVGPFEVLRELPGSEVVLCAEAPGRVADESGLVRLDVPVAFAEVARPDVLLVPGGLATRRLAAPGAPIVEWIRAAHPTTTFTTSVCTGALRLGGRRGCWRGGGRRRTGPRPVTWPRSAPRRRRSGW